MLGRTKRQISDRYADVRLKVSAATLDFPPQYLPPLSAFADSEAVAGTRYKKAGGAERPERGPVSRGFPWRESYCRSPRRLPCRWGGTRVSQSRRLKYFFLLPQFNQPSSNCGRHQKTPDLVQGPVRQAEVFDSIYRLPANRSGSPSPSRVLPDKHKKPPKFRGAPPTRPLTECVSSACCPSCFEHRFKRRPGSSIHFAQLAPGM